MKNNSGIDSGAQRVESRIESDVASLSDAQDLAHAVAIVGMAGRFPGAASTNELWKNICDGVESISRFSETELEDSFGAEVRNAPNFVKARPILSDVDQFDADFFGIYAKEAELMDPQHRLFLECAWQALEDAGYEPAQYVGNIGVFAGSSVNTYFLNNVCKDQSTLTEFTNNYQVGSYAMLTGAAQDFLATRVSYKLDLKGPSVTVQSACSTSLLAVAQACQSLLLYQSDMALAGGVSITLPQKRGYLSQEGGMVSADGHCRSFDAQASGTIFGSGLGVVLLKRMEDALRDGDQIYAVIRGCGVNNDGADKVGFTAPSINGQAAAIEMALAAADVDARSISYVECHGTGTPLGDPIEIAGLTQAYRTHTTENNFCAIGSIKTNVGHLDVAAGVTGLIKTALALKHKRLPATLHFKQPNPQIDFANSPFYVNGETKAWPASSPRRAGVSAFGVGGTNVHLILEEAPNESAQETRAQVTQVLPLSAKTATALKQARANLANHLREHADLNIADVAYTLQMGRRSFDYRCAIVASDLNEAIEKLTSNNANRTADEKRFTKDPSIVFMFPGQGAQYPQMGRDLYESEAAFQREVDACANILLPIMNLDIRDYLFPTNNDAAAANVLRATANAQPALFVLEYSLARLWMEWGIKPNAMLGHSVGEFVAAVLAGVMSLEDALSLIAARGQLMQQLPGGSMLSVRCAENKLIALLTEAKLPSLALAAINSPNNCVVSGPNDSVTSFEALLMSRDIVCRQLHTSHAFHSPMMTPILEPFRELVHRVSLSPPVIPFISCVSGQLITDEQATSPDYWMQHIREAVRFADGLKTLNQEEPCVFVEVGPGNTLATLARQTLQREQTFITSSLPTADQLGTALDRVQIKNAVAQLWTRGVEPNWRAIHGERCRRVSLPTYPFERRRYWLDARPVKLQDKTLEDNKMASQASGYSQTTVESIEQVDAKLVVDEPKSNERLQIARQLCSLFEELSGEQRATPESKATFLELGFDSLFLTQVAQRVQKQFKVKITFRQLLGELATIQALADFIDKSSDKRDVAVVKKTAVAAPLLATNGNTPAEKATSMIPSGLSSIDEVMKEQLKTLSQLMERQLETLRSMRTDQSTTTSGITVEASKHHPVPTSAGSTTASRFQVYAGNNASPTAELTVDQRQHIESLIARYTQKTQGSKQYTQHHRKTLADPRAAAGFRAEWKEMVYPIVAERAIGAKIWDVDGNEYIDLVNGYGQTAFGHSPDFVVAAVQAQLSKGFAIGPQAELAGEVAGLISELTGNERVAFCNTGSEAVMAAMRIARAVTGRDKVVVFEGAYHGQFDEVLVHAAQRGSSEPKSLPVAVGIPRASVQNMVVLEYASSTSLQWIREHAEDIAAVIVEPVQSRRPQLVPIEFLRELREITAAADIAFVMDEVVTGFRVHPGGMQSVLDIRADLATYGKVVGGGLPIGIVAGKAKFMDALDGGQWNYGDDSFPEVGVTFFAGTFVRHPLALAATLAVLKHLKQAGATLQTQLADRTQQLVDELNRDFKSAGLTTELAAYSSWFYFNLSPEHPLASLFFYHLRLRGIHIQEGFPCFMTTAHTDEDMQHIVMAFRESLRELTEVGILGKYSGESIASPSVSPSEAKCISLTENQTEIWLAAQQGDEASCAFNESITLRMHGVLNEVALEQALNQIVARHDALRAKFTATGENMIIAPEAVLTIERHPRVVVTTAERAEAELKALIDRDACTPFNLVNEPPIRAHLLTLTPQSHALLLTAHHIVCDGWSLNVIVSELAELYTAICLLKGAALPKPLSFSDYAISRTKFAHEEVEKFWLNEFSTMPPSLTLPTDRPRGAHKSFDGATTYRFIDADLYQKIKTAGASHGSTLFVTLLAAFQALLGRLAEQNEVVIGVPFAGQALLDNETLVGHAVDFLPIRTRWSDTTKVLEHLSVVAKQVVDAREHQSYTLGTLIQKLALRDSNRLPLTEVQFNLERLADNFSFADLEVEMEPNPKLRVNFDVFLNITESSRGLRLDCSYRTELFDSNTIDHWLACYQAMLESWTVDSEQLLTRTPYLPAATRQQVLVDFNNTRKSWPNDKTILELFAEQVRTRPKTIAAQFADRSLTYDELNRRVNQLAYFIADKIKIGQGDAQIRIAICLPRSLDMLIALLAVWRAGGAYVPLDPQNPAARLQYILHEAEVAAVIVSGVESVDLLDNKTPIIDLQRDAETIASTRALPLRVLSADDVAYLIYTSGSTGLPKGVEIVHRSIVNLLTDMAQLPGMKQSDVLFAVTTISFDIAVLELFLPLVVGAKVIIASSDEVGDGERLKARLDATGSTMMQATPSTWRLLLEAGFTAKNDFKMLCGGEPLSRELANQLLAQGGELWNMYGPTETTVWSSCVQIKAGNTPITIGRPIANTQFYILDSHDQLVPMGAHGELLIGGEGVARGYYLRPELNTEKFIANPFGTGRLYRTGDRARYLPGGDVQLLGRRDGQVKLRGYRIELGEIEAMLSQHSEVSAAAVVLQSDATDSQRLVAYVVGPSADNSRALRAHLEARLPGYMIPTAWVFLSALPTLANGKLDRAALPFPPAAAANPREFVAPSTASETMLTKVWEEVLKLDRVGITDDIFSLGADSIHLFQITARANRDGLGISAKQLVQYRTIAEVLKHLDRAAESAMAAPSMMSLRQFKLSRAQKNTAQLH